MGGAWQFWIDRGGTFTDVIGAAPDGRLVLRKVPSGQASAGTTDPGLEAAFDMLREAGVPAAGAAHFKVGTTVATNALLERRGSRVLLVTTRGFGDALLIGNQSRPDLFALHIQRPPPLFERVLEVDERIDADGTVLAEPDLAVIGQALRRARDAGLESVAILLMHGWRHTAHESAIAAVADATGFAQVTCSHQCLPLPRFVPRGDSTVFESYLATVLRGFVDGLALQLVRDAPGARLDFMQSSGGLTGASRFRALASVLSGPAGGLIGMARLGESAGLRRLIGFDMGGTSTDVSVHDGAFERRFEHEIAGARITTPMLDVHTIAAGGGSILALHDGRCRVGPGSAGADPGPACYGRGGPATLTDVQVLLGRLSPDSMPRVFGPGRDAPIDPQAAAVALAALDDAVAPETLAAGFLDVAVAAMANAIRHVSVRQGIDPTGFTLLAFGGAAGQHACRVAQACGVDRVLVHPLASVLSAFGIGVADRIEVRRRGLGVPLDAAGWQAAGRLAADLAAQACAALADQEPGTPTAAMTVTTLLELREGHAETSLDIQGDSPEALRGAFATEHLRRFGYAPALDRLQVAAVRVEARVAAGARGGGTTAAPRWRIESGAVPGRPDGSPPRSTRAWFGGWRDVPVHDARLLQTTLEGPALLVEPHSTFVLEPGWRIGPAGDGALLAERIADTAGVAARPDVSDPSQVEIHDGLFMHIATQMGEVLRRTAQSVNIKERLDFSCALFDAEGGLVANAPHMPVHLGSMGATVKALLRTRRGRMQRGDAWLVNDPANGGTHLPDITVVSPVFTPSGTAPAFFVASRAHHADIGGITPGSMPPFSTRLDQEGAVFEDFELVAGGQLREAALRAALAAGPWPARNAGQNLADLRAQLAANARGAEELLRAAAEHGAARITAAMRAVQDNAADCVEAAIARLGDRSAAFATTLDGGQRIAVRIELDARLRRARIDFSGTSPAGAHNFNAPRAVTLAAVLYVFRTLVERPIPLNEGCLRPLDIVVPAGSLLDPPIGAAVVAGNVETSQMIVDVLYGALGLLAASQGTMNNLTFGDATLQYYETIAGGSGAGPGFPGCDAVQTHMTNSRLTDPEILESRFPVRLREFSIRRGSGGPGLQRGGDGALRRLEFLAPLHGAILANRRSTQAFGLAGGGPGAAGITRILRSDGSVETLPASAGFDLGAGDQLEILTPGGGGHGAPPERPA